MAVMGTVEVVVKAEHFNRALEDLRDNLLNGHWLPPEWAQMLSERERLQVENDLLRRLLHDQTPRLVIPDETIPMALAGAAIAATSSPRRFSRRRLLGLR